MVDLGRPARSLGGRGLTLVVAAALAGCAVVPGSRLDESQRLVQSLRTENARLKDQVLGLEAQNRDYADRAVDDLRRLTARDRAIERLESSVQAYQDDRDRLAAAYHRLAAGLGRPAEDTATAGADSRGGGPAGPSVARGDRAWERASEALSPHGDEDAGRSPRPVPAGGSAP